MNAQCIIYDDGKTLEFLFDDEVHISSAHRKEHVLTLNEVFQAIYEYVDKVNS